ncbi:uncharacterized protein LOC141699902 [Apium graveolens]|uniref:uncharacterized protein LOC141699902 n=1 Tax=Apium graveolens TaxID=4045 RepID=UPI003D7AA718
MEIQITGQPWLNNVDNPYISTNSPSLLNQRVVSLFRTGTKEWDMEIIKDIFDTRDQHYIANTRVEQDLNKDTLDWKLDNSGQNSTKHVQIDNIYPVCHEEAESVFHSLVQCKAATLGWQIHNPNISTNETMEFAEWLDRNLSGQPTQATAKIITLCWSIWRARNDLWTAAQGRYTGAPLRSPIAGDCAIYWAKPQQDEVKINADAAVFDNQGSGTGLVVRNHASHMLSAKTTCFSEVMNPTLAEALAIKEALSWAKEWTENTITIESDCLVVIQLIRSATSLRSRLGKVIMECRTLVRELNNVRLYFIKRSSNMSAHKLAHVSHMYPDRVFDWGYISVNVKSCISNELLE